MKIAVVLFNLGGPSHQKEVKPFLLNLFSDPQILRFPSIIRYPLAWLIATLRHKKAQGIYQKMGGGSPLFKNTMDQAKSLEACLVSKKMDAKVFLAMRYTPPFARDIINDIKAISPDKIILLPLYPQFSNTTTKSFFAEWDKCAALMKSLTKEIPCYPTDKIFVKAHQELILDHLQQLPKIPLRLVFSAHGIPLDPTDPYSAHIEATVNAVMGHPSLKEYSFTFCYQSRVGPKKWLEPYLETALRQSVVDGKGVVIIPISFVSEHAETLVELDMDYKERAATMGIIHYSRVPALGINSLFIEALAGQVMEAVRE